MSIKKLAGIAACVAMLLVLCGVGAYLVSRSDAPKTTTQTQERDGAAAGGEAYKVLMRSKLAALGYSGYTVTSEVEAGKFEVEANGKVGKCPVELKWVVGVLTAAEQAAPTVKPGTAVRIKLDEVYNTSKKKMQKYTALSTTDPKPADIRKALNRNGSPCKP